jgi:hypothetical protein
MISAEEQQGEHGRTGDCGGHHDPEDGHAAARTQCYEQAAEVVARGQVLARRLEP